MGQVRDAAKNARMSKIQQAAERLLRERSIHDVTMKELAQEAGVGEATLFRYLGTKDALLFLVYGSQMDQLLTEIEERDVKVAMNYSPSQRTPDHYASRILEMYRLRCEFYLQNPENASIYLRAGFDKENTNRWRNLAQGDRTIRLSTQILAEARSLGLLDADVSLISSAQNCHAIYMHEIDRTPTRELDPLTIWERVEPRLQAQLKPLFVRNTPRKGG